MPLPLAGRTVVVTRAAERTGDLAGRLSALGATVLEVPTIATADPDDGGAALRGAVARLATFDWVVVTSPAGVERFAGALDEQRGRGRWRLAVVGPGTADAARRLGLGVDLVPERFVAEGLVEVFPAGPGRVLVAQAAAARPVVGEGLRAKAWEVEAVIAYQTVAAPIAPDVLGAVEVADAITFTSASTVEHFLAAGAHVLPPVVVCIGPITADAARRRGVEVTAVAESHDLSGLVAAVARALRAGPPAHRE